MFSDEMIGYYDFYIHSVTYDGTPSYLFEAKVKPEFKDKVNKTVIKELKTWFSKKDFQVLSRTYALSHDTALYMFDVRMHVDLEKQTDHYLPAFIRYEGIWNVPFQKKESGFFEIRFDHHSTPNYRHLFF